MVEASCLIELRDLLERSLGLADAAGDTFLGVVIDTALQDVIGKIEEGKASE